MDKLSEAMREQQRVAVAPEIAAKDLLLRTGKSVAAIAATTNFPAEPAIEIKAKPVSLILML